MNQERLDIKALWLIFRKSWWILVLGVVGMAAAAFFASKSITPIYEATTLVLVQGGKATEIGSVGEVQANERLASNYRELVRTRPNLERVIESLSLPYSPGDLSSKISVTTPRSLIEIRAKDPSPQLAAQIANATAQTFIDDFRERQFSQIAQFRASLRQYGITDEPTSRPGQMATIGSISIAELNLIAAQAVTMSTLNIVELAIPPSSPSSPNIGLNVILAAVLGLLERGTLGLCHRISGRQDQVAR